MTALSRFPKFAEHRASPILYDPFFMLQDKAFAYSTSSSAPRLNALPCVSGTSTNCQDASFACEGEAAVDVCGEVLDLGPPAASLRASRSRDGHVFTQE